MSQNQSLGAKDQQTNVQSRALNDNLDPPDEGTINFSNPQDDNNDTRTNKKQEKTEENTKEKTEEKKQTKAEQKREKQWEKLIKKARKQFYNSSNCDLYLRIDVEAKENQDTSQWLVCKKCEPVLQLTLLITIYVICALEIEDGNRKINIIPFQDCYTNQKKFVSCLHNKSNPKNDPKCAKQYGWKLEGNFFNKGSQANYEIKDWNDACAYSDYNRNIICNFLRNHVLKYTKQQNSNLVQVSKLPQIAYMLEILESKQQYKNNLLKGSNELEVLILEKHRHI